MKILLLIIIVFTLDVFAQSSIVVGTGATIDLGTGTNLDVGSYSGTFTGNGAINSSPLPVELTSFTASISNGQVLLNWETATEVNNYGFEIERQKSEDSSQESVWETIGFIQGHGNSNSPKSYEFVDENPPAGNLTYRLKQIDTDGTFEYFDQTVTVDLRSITDVEEDAIVTAPNEFELAQNYPNPFNPSTTVKVAVPENGEFTLNIFNILGQKVATIFNGELKAGYYSFDFDASSVGRRITSGIYIYSFQGKNIKIAKKMSLIK